MDRSVRSRDVHALGPRDPEAVSKRLLHGGDPNWPPPPHYEAYELRGLSEPQLRTVARQCYAWTLPYGVSFTEDVDVKDGEIVNDSLKNRLEMMVRDVRVYGELLGRQRRADLAGNDPGFLARHRSSVA